ncbi:fimbrillin family protein [Parabacteroides sp. APC149_11_2_Y6]
MKKQILLVVLVTLALFSCTPENNNGTDGGGNGGSDTKNLILSATIDDDTLSFKAGDEIGLFVTTASGGKYGDIESNIKAQYNTTWKTSMSSPLSEEPAKVYAYSPYVSGATDVKAVPIFTDGKKAVLYGTQNNEDVINNGNNSASLVMKHALSTVAFNFSKTNYYGAGRLEKVEILNGEGRKVFASHGTLDCTTGKVSLIPEDTAKVVKDCKLTQYDDFSNIRKGLREFPLIRSIPEGQPIEDNIQYLRVLPMETLQSDGDIVFRFTIDGVAYTYPVKAGTTWKQGETSFYTFTLEGEEINLDKMFNITWAEPGYPGSYDYVPFPAEAKPAILHAMKIWAQCLDIKVPLNAVFSFAPLRGAAAVSAVGSYYIENNRDYRYPETLKNQMVGYDSEPYSPEIEITFNSDGWWYYGTDGKYLEKPIDDTASTIAMDLLSVTLHEMCHSFGFSSTLHPNENEHIGTKAQSEPLDMDIFGSFMVDKNGRSLKDYPDHSRELYDVLVSGKISFAGPNAVMANKGEPVPMADNTPNPTWNTSHLEGFNIMANGEYHHPGTIILAMLQDIGWDIKPLPVLKEQN